MGDRWPLHWDGKQRVCVVAAGARVLTLVACGLLLLAMSTAFGFAIATLRYAELASYHNTTGRVNHTNVLPCDPQLTTGVPVWVMSFLDPDCKPAHEDAFGLDFGATDVPFRPPVAFSAAWAIVNSSTAWQVGKCVPVYVPGKRAEFYAEIFRAIATRGYYSFSEDQCHEYTGIDRGERRLCLPKRLSDSRAQALFWTLLRSRGKRRACWPCLS